MKAYQSDSDKRRKMLSQLNDEIAAILKAESG